MSTLLQPLIEIPNFLGEDLDTVRNLGLSYSYRKAGGQAEYPGYRSDPIHDTHPKVFELIWPKVYKALGLDLSIPSTISMTFQYCTKDDISWVHQDPERYKVALIYLTPDPPERSGTILFHPVKDYDHYNQRDLSNYTVKSTISNEYGKLISYDTREFHMSDRYFGDSIYNARLFLMVFIELEK